MLLNRIEHLNLRVALYRLAIFTRTSMQFPDSATDLSSRWRLLTWRLKVDDWVGRIKAPGMSVKVCERACQAADVPLWDVVGGHEHDPGELPTRCSPVMENGRNRADIVRHQ